MTPGRLLPLILGLTVAAHAAPETMPETAIRGHLTPRRFTTLSAEMTARVEKITAREGERFKEGQPLVVLDCTIQRAQLERAREVSASAERVWAAHRRMVELKTAGQLATETAALEAAKARGDLQVLVATLTKCLIHAPFPGRVVEQKAREQQVVQSGQALLELLDDSSLEFEFIAPSHLIGQLAPGQPCQIQVEETGKSYPSRIVRLGAKIDPVSQSMKVMGEITGHFPELMAGMSGRVLLQAP